MQQKASNHSQQTNKLKQRRESQTCSYCNSDCSVIPFHKKMKYYQGEIKADAKHQIKKSKDGIKTLGHISDDTKCLIHPNASHNWGECYANAANKKIHKTNGNQALASSRKIRSMPMLCISAMMS
jgi:hypothetical protein